MADRTKNRKRESLDKPMCKYGLSCYRKNPEHHKQYRHPSPLLPDENGAGDSPPKMMKNGEKSSNTLAEPIDDIKKKSPARKTQKDKEITPIAKSSDIKEMFLVELPPDFYHLWDFCSSLKADDPAELFADLGLHLVGPYDVLSKKISKKDVQSDNILRHWRYYYDPPEFQTVIKRDGDDCYHIGYFRDDPSEPPFAVASNSASIGPKFKHMGDNIFCALNLELSTAIKKVSQKDAKKKFETIQEELQKYAARCKCSLAEQTPKTKARAKAVVAKTFHEFGIVVPYDKKQDLGYRSIPETDAKLKTILSKIANSQTEEASLTARIPLDEILTDLQFANDECDFGMGLELGIDLFCFGDPCLHKDVLNVLGLAYNLLKRPEFGKILQSHLSDRRKGDQLSIKT